MDSEIYGIYPKEWHHHSKYFFKCMFAGQLPRAWRLLLLQRVSCKECWFAHRYVSRKILEFHLPVFQIEFCLGAFYALPYQLSNYLHYYRYVFCMRLLYRLNYTQKCVMKYRFMWKMFPLIKLDTIYPILVKAYQELGMPTFCIYTVLQPSNPNVECCMPDPLLWLRDDICWSNWMYPSSQKKRTHASPHKL